MGICVIAGLANFFGIANAESPAELREQLRGALAKSNSEKAVEILDKLIAAEPDVPIYHYYRGCEQFRMGRYQQSLADFDAFLKLEPNRKTSLWERGITCYFCEEYEQGAKQFEIYQQYYDQDVENSVWRYMCMAKSDGIEKAKAELISIERDRRHGLMDVFRLFQGEVTVQQLATKVDNSDLKGTDLAAYQFYSWLYLGLYLQVHDQPNESNVYLKKASDPELLQRGSRLISRYMFDVAEQAQTLN